jgi:hypothetical protein
MRTRNLQFAIAILILVALVACAGQPTPFSTLFASANVVLVGEIESAARIPDSAARTEIAPPEPLQHVALYPCEFTVRVRAIIKAPRSPVKVGPVVQIIWYLPSPTCAVSYLGDDRLLGKPALWLARSEGGSLRTIADDTSTVLPILEFTEQTEDELKQWRDPGSAVTYLVLKPGVIIPENGYVGSTLPSDVVAITGFADFLRIYRVIYLESDARKRGLISLEVAGYGQCLASAKRAAELERRRGTPLPYELFLDPEVERRTEEHDLAEEDSWTSKAQLVKVFGSVGDAVDGLTMRACRSDIRVRTRARELLSSYFGIDSSTLACIPCE